MLSLSIGIPFVTLVFTLLITGAKAHEKGNLALMAVLSNVALSSGLAVSALAGRTQEALLDGGRVFGQIAVRIDALSGWFILLMNFTVLTGILYGRRYMKKYEKQTTAITLHFTAYIVNHAAMIGIFCLQNALAFLVVWEIMAISAFLLIIFEHGKIEILKAGLNFLVQSHICILLLTFGFIWVNAHSGSLDFTAVTRYTASVSPAVSFLLFLCFFAGFAIKAGFVPFHTWLPYAHPASPSHVSGVLSGVILKLGIYGILRMVLLIKGDELSAGYFILFISLVTGIYGVMLAIVQHNVKKLLAYHSIENIGIIGIGIGLGCIGLGSSNGFLAFAGFAGALLHTLNHSLFKSLLFYAAGTVHQAAHTLEIERLGGLIKKMPQTAVLFLVASLAICGLPPFNGFISEFLLYSGLFRAIAVSDTGLATLFVAAVLGLVLIGGMALLCFTKAFGIIFLGTARHPLPADICDPEPARLFPKYLTAAAIVLIGLAPMPFIAAVSGPVSLFTGRRPDPAQLMEWTSIFRSLGIAAMVLILLSAAVWRIKRWAARQASATTAPTWGCGYPEPSPKLQFTANSFVRSFRKLVRPLLMMNKKEGEIKSVFPGTVHSESHPYDRLEALLIDRPLAFLRKFMGRFNFVQNGNLQFYILYGVVYIFILIAIPLLVGAFAALAELFKQI